MRKECKQSPPRDADVMTVSTQYYMSDVGPTSEDR